MSFNISKKMLEKSKVTVEILMDSLTPIQLSKFKKCIETGFVSGNGVPATAARRWMKDKNLPHLWQPYAGYVDIRRTPVDHPLRELLKRAILMSKMEVDSDRYDAEGMLTRLKLDTSDRNYWYVSRIHILNSTRKVLQTHKTGYEVPTEVVFVLGEDEHYGSM